MSRKKLDLTGLNCPLPVLHARKALDSLGAGSVVEIQATDPASVKDFTVFCRKTSSEIIHQAEDGGVFTFHIRKGA